MLSPDSCFIPLKYESLGRAVIPTGKAGDSKRPFVSWKQYHHKSPQPDDLLRWQEEFSPTNWAMVCGRVSGILVLDCDSETSCQWATSTGLEPAVESPSGLHFYFSSAGSTIATATLELRGTSFEFKGEKSLANFYVPGYTVLEQAVNPEGLYSFAELPLDFRACLTRPRITPRHQTDVIYEGERNATLFRLASSLRRIGMTYESIMAALCVENQAKCRPPLSEAEVGAIARSVDRYEPEVSLTDIVKGLAHISVPASAMRVYSVILDETINRNKVENWLAYSKLEAATGLPQNEVWRGLRRLRESRNGRCHQEGRKAPLHTNAPAGMDDLMTAFGTYSNSEGGACVQPTPKMRDTITKRGWKGGTSSYPPPKEWGPGGRKNVKTVTPFPLFVNLGGVQVAK